MDEARLLRLVWPASSFFWYATGPRRLVALPHRDGFVDVHDEHEQQANLDRHDERVRDERCEYSLKVSRPRKISTFPATCSDHVDDEKKTGDADEELGPD